MSKRVPVSNCQRILAGVWFGGAGLAFVVLLVQTLRGVYGGQTQRAWGWFLPTVLPTLSLIAGVVASDALASAKETTVSSLVYNLSLWLSVFYVLLVLTTFVVQPFSSTPIAVMETSHLWLGPVQGLVGSVLGVFFVSRKTEP